MLNNKMKSQRRLVQHVARRFASVCSIQETPSNQGSRLIARSILTATPDLRFVPHKYHKYILPTVRRIYISQPTAQTNSENVTYLKSVISALENRTETLGETNTFLRSRVSSLEKRVAGLTQDKERLMDRCEAGLANIKNLGEKERDARHEKENLEKELESLRRKYDAMKGKYKTMKHA
jgi:hypothetical protein